MGGADRFLKPEQRNNGFLIHVPPFTDEQTGRTYKMEVGICGACGGTRNLIRVFAQADGQGLKEVRSFPLKCRSPVCRAGENKTGGNFQAGRG